MIISGTQQFTHRAWKVMPRYRLKMLLCSHLEYLTCICVYISYISPCETPFWAVSTSEQEKAYVHKDPALTSSPEYWGRGRRSLSCTLAPALPSVDTFKKKGVFHNNVQWAASTLLGNVFRYQVWTRFLSNHDYLRKLCFWSFFNLQLYIHLKFF